MARVFVHAGSMENKRHWMLSTLPLFVIFYVATTMVTLLYMPQMTDHIRNQPLFFMVALPIPLVLSDTASIYWIFRGKVRSSSQSD